MRKDVITLYFSKGQSNSDWRKTDDLKDPMPITLTKSVSQSRRAEFTQRRDTISWHYTLND